MPETTPPTADQAIDQALRLHLPDDVAGTAAGEASPAIEAPPGFIILTNAQNKRRTFIAVSTIAFVSPPDNSGLGSVIAIRDTQLMIPSTESVETIAGKIADAIAAQRRADAEAKLKNYCAQLDTFTTAIAAELPKIFRSAVATASGPAGVSPPPWPAGVSSADIDAAFVDKQIAEVEAQLQPPPATTPAAPPAASSGPSARHRRRQ